jgi:hypothetical protein
MCTDSHVPLDAAVVTSRTRRRVRCRRPLDFSCRICEILSNSLMKRVAFSMSWGFASIPFQNATADIRQSLTVAALRNIWPQSHGVASALPCLRSFWHKCRRVCLRLLPSLRLISQATRSPPAARSDRRSRFLLLPLREAFPLLLPVCHHHHHQSRSRRQPPQPGAGMLRQQSMCFVVRMC